MSTSLLTRGMVYPVTVVYPEGDYIEGFEISISLDNSHLEKSVDLESEELSISVAVD